MHFSWENSIVQLGHSYNSYNSYVSHYQRVHFSCEIPLFADQIECEIRQGWDCWTLLCLNKHQSGNGWGMIHHQYTYPIDRS